MKLDWQSKIAIVVIMSLLILVFFIKVFVRVSRERHVFDRTLAKYQSALDKAKSEIGRTILIDAGENVFTTSNSTQLKVPSEVPSNALGMNKTDQIIKNPNREEYERLKQRTYECEKQADYP